MLTQKRRQGDVHVDSAEGFARQTDTKCCNCPKEKHPPSA